MTHFRRRSGEHDVFFQKNKDHAAFPFVYIDEAHPSDGWQTKSNEKDGVIFQKPKNLGERHSVAQACCTRLNLTIPCVVDTIDNAVDNLYASWPERMFVVDRDGKITYAGRKGPWGANPNRPNARCVSCSKSFPPPVTGISQ